MRKALGLTLVLIICLTLLMGCAPSEKAATTAKPAAKETAAAKMFDISFTNASNYIFNEIYISPTAANDMGDELLGSTSVLKSNGSVDVKITAYDYENYDIMIVDEDRDQYHFTRVPLTDKSKVSIYFSDGSLIADVADASGAAVITVEGTLNPTAGSEVEEEDTSWIAFNLVNASNLISFTEAYFMPAGTNDESEMGYNHILSIGKLNQWSTAQIGVENHVYFDVLFIDTDGDQWYYQEIFLGEGCTANITYNNDAYLEVEYSNGTTAEFVGSIY